MKLTKQQHDDLMDVAARIIGLINDLRHYLDQAEVVTLQTGYLRAQAQELTRMVAAIRKTPAAPKMKRTRQ